MQILCKFYANFIAISLFCGLLAIHNPAWAQIYSHGTESNCSGKEWHLFDLPPLLSIQQRIDSSSFVFEGLIVSSKNIQYQERDYVCATIAVKRIYKGDFVTDTVEVLSYYGYNHKDKRAQYIEEINENSRRFVFFVNQNKVFNTSLQSGRLRFRLAFLNRSATTWDEVAIALGTCYGDCIVDEPLVEATGNNLKKITKQCVEVEKYSKKKAKRKLR